MNFIITVFVIVGFAAAENGPEAAENEPIIFRIPDGTKENSYIGNLPQNANFASNSEKRKFLIVTGDNLIKVRSFLVIIENKIEILRIF